MRAMSYNILNGGAGREAALLEVARTVQPDLLFMQEIRDHANAQHFARALSMGFRHAPSNTPNRQVALLSHLPIAASAAPRRFPLLRALLATTVTLPDRRALNLFCVHLGLLHDEWRRAEVQTIVRLIAEYEQAHPAAFSLVGGDFNTVAPGERIGYRGAPLLYKAVFLVQFAYFRRALNPLRAAGYVDCFRALHPADDGFTMPTPAPRLRLDYLFASPPLAERLRACAVVTAPAARHASDHFPLMAEFEIEGGL